MAIEDDREAIDALRNKLEQLKLTIGDVKKVHKQASDEFRNTKTPDYNFSDEARNDYFKLTKKLSDLNKTIQDKENKIRDLDVYIEFYTNNTVEWKNRNQELDDEFADKPLGDEKDFDFLENQLPELKTKCVQIKTECLQFNENIKNTVNQFLKNTQADIEPIVQQVTEARVDELNRRIDDIERVVSAPIPEIDYNLVRAAQNAEDIFKQKQIEYERARDHKLNNPAQYREIGGTKSQELKDFEKLEQEYNVALRNKQDAVRRAQENAQNHYRALRESQIYRAAYSVPMVQATVTAFQLIKNESELAAIGGGVINKSSEIYKALKIIHDDIAIEERKFKSAGPAESLTIDRKIKTLKGQYANYFYGDDEWDAQYDDEIANVKKHLESESKITTLKTETKKQKEALVKICQDNKLGLKDTVVAELIKDKVAVEPALSSLGTNIQKTTEEIAQEAHHASEEEARRAENAEREARARVAFEEALRVRQQEEAARRAQEEEAVRQEAERRAQEEAVRQEAARRAQEEEAARRAREQAGDGRPLEEPRSDNWIFAISNSGDSRVDYVNLKKFMREIFETSKGFLRDNPNKSEVDELNVPIILIHDTVRLLRSNGKLDGTHDEEAAKIFYGTLQNITDHVSRDSVFDKGDLGGEVCEFVSYLHDSLIEKDLILNGNFREDSKLFLDKSSQLSQRLNRLKSKPRPEPGDDNLMFKFISPSTNAEETIDLRGLLSKVVEECDTIDPTGADLVSQVVSFLRNLGSHLKDDLESWSVSEKEVAQHLKGALQAIQSNIIVEFVDINQPKAIGLNSLVYEVLNNGFNSKSYLDDDYQESAKQYVEENIEPLEEIMEALVSKEIVNVVQQFAKDQKRPTRDNEYYEYDQKYYEISDFLNQIYMSCEEIENDNVVLNDSVAKGIALIKENLTALDADGRRDKEGAKILLGTLQLLEDLIPEVEVRTNVVVGERYLELIRVAKAGLQFKDDIGLGDYRQAAKDYIALQAGLLEVSYNSVANPAAPGAAPGFTQAQIDELDQNIRDMQQAVQAIELEIQNVARLRDEYERKEIECESHIIDCDREMLDIHSKIVGEDFRTMTSILESNNATHLVEEANRLSAGVRKPVSGMSQAHSNGIQSTIQNYLTAAQQSEVDWADAHVRVAELKQNLTDIITAYTDYKHILEGDKIIYAGAKLEARNQITTLNHAKNFAEAAIQAFTDAKVLGNYAAKKAEGMNLINDKNQSQQASQEASGRCQAHLRLLNEPRKQTALQAVQDERQKTDALANSREAALTKANDGKARLVNPQTDARAAKNRYDTAVLSWQQQQKATEQKAKAKATTIKRTKDLGL